jgi:hypothetical protein
MIYAPGVKLQQVARGLWRWTARHPDWEPAEEKDDPADWAPDVGCVAYQAADTLVLIDPLVADGDHEQLDELARASARVAVLTTVKWHDRSGAELAKRYDATTEPPPGVTPVEIPGAGETIFWIPEHGALVPGDRILGDRPPGLRICPESWLRHLGGFASADLREALRERLLDLPVELVLVSHGQPVLADGRRELERALA